MGIFRLVYTTLTIAKRVNIFNIIALFATIYKIEMLKYPISSHFD